MSLGWYVGRGHGSGSASTKLYKANVASWGSPLSLIQAHCHQSWDAISESTMVGPPLFSRTTDPGLNSFFSAILSSPKARFMLLESAATPPKRPHARRSAPVEAAPASAKRPTVRKVGETPNANGIARAALVNTLASLIARTKSSVSRKWVTYAVATQSQSLSEAWRNESKKALIACGSLPDYQAYPLEAGTHLTIYNDPLVTVGVKVVAQASHLDADAFCADLLAAGFKASTLKRLRKKHTTEFKPAHIITAMLAAP
jgi:hypothetical protein